MMSDDQAVHERRVADQRAGLRIAQRRPGRKRQQREDHDDRRAAPTAHTSGRATPRRRVCSRLRLWLAAACSALYFAQPRLDRSCSVMSATTHRQHHDRGDREPEVGVRSIDCVGIDQVDGVVGESRRGRASSGLISMFTVNAPATPANPAPGRRAGWRPTLRKAAPASGISTR